MKHLLVILLVIATALGAVAEEPRLKIKPIRGYSAIDNPDVDDVEPQLLMIHLSEVTVYPPLKFKNKKEEEFYWKTVRDVRKTLPYAKMICETMIETYEYLETLPDQKARDAHIKKMEGAIFEQYKPDLKKFTKSQAQMLCKLINRETDSSGYGILKAFLGAVRATFWQAFGKVFGVNIKSSFNPKKDKNDAIIERVATQIEQGTL